MQALVTQVVLWALGQTQIRAFLEELFMRLFSELFFKSNTDSDFHQKFLLLSSKLAGAATEDDKRAILAQISALRSNAQ